MAMEEDILPEKFRHALAVTNQLRDRNCTHGGPPPGAPSTRRKCAILTSCMYSLAGASQAVLSSHANDDLPIEALTSERSRAKLQAMVNFWLPHGGDIDQEYPRLCFSMATDATLDDNLEHARQFLQVGLFLNAWCVLGQDTLLGALTSQEQLPPNVEKLYADRLYHTRTNRGMIRFLHNETKHSCKCLAELAALEKAKPRTAKCNYCKKEGESIKLKKCSRCKLSEYCSKECQTNDWKVHKAECRKPPE